MTCKFNLTKSYLSWPYLTEFIVISVSRHIHNTQRLSNSISNNLSHAESLLSPLSLASLKNFPYTFYSIISLVNIQHLNCTPVSLIYLTTIQYIHGLCSEMQIGWAVLRGDKKALGLVYLIFFKNVRRHKMSFFQFGFWLLCLYLGNIDYHYLPCLDLLRNQQYWPGPISVPSSDPKGPNFRGWRHRLLTRSPKLPDGS